MRTVLPLFIGYLFEDADVLFSRNQAGIQGSQLFRYFAIDLGL